MTAHGQLDLAGGEAVDPRLEQAAKALWWEDAKRTWGRDGTDVAREHAKEIWPRVRGSYVAKAEMAMRAFGAI